MNDGLIKKIKEEVLKTGFPLELRIADFLNRNKYYIAHSLYYIDEDGNKSREVDLRALKNFGLVLKIKNSSSASPSFILQEFDYLLFSKRALCFQNKF